MSSSGAKGLNGIAQRKFCETHAVLFLWDVGWNILKIILLYFRTGQVEISMKSNLQPYVVISTDSNSSNRCMVYLTPTFRLQKMLNEESK